MSNQDYEKPKLLDLIFAEIDRCCINLRCELIVLRGFKCLTLLFVLIRERLDNKNTK